MFLREHIIFLLIFPLNKFSNNIQIQKIFEKTAIPESIKLHVSKRDAEGLSTNTNKWWANIHMLHAFGRIITAKVTDHLESKNIEIKGM